jgi:hypothetical protein
MMHSIKIRRKTRLASLNQAMNVTTKSGIPISIMDDQWKILPNVSKGHTILVAWLHDSPMLDDEWQLCVDVFIWYIRTKSASTAYGVVGNTKDHLIHGIPDLTQLKGKWSGVPTHQKKSLNQFFGTLCKLGHKQFNDFHTFTRTNLDKEKKNNLDPESGSMTEFEFDSLAKLINTRLGSVDWSKQRNLAFYRSKAFSQVRTIVANKLMLATVRRPIQLSVLKWCDLIPTGVSFKDRNISPLNELGTLGSSTLQLRVFHAKEKGGSHQRTHPERYPIPLSEDLSEVLFQYKRLCLHGLQLLLEELDLVVGEQDLIHMMSNVPMFPDLELFRWRIHSLKLFESAFTEASSLFHAADHMLTMDLRGIPSDRAPTCRASNNRIRHTVLTRGAQAGLPAVQLARVTGVTVPAARHYVDMDYESRRLIDANYVGNEFLKRAFSGSVTLVPEGDEEILGHDFNEVGGAKFSRTCITCKSALGRPIGCYGCPNFRPILQANHRAELQIAMDKLSANRDFLLNPLEANSTRKLKVQVEWIKLTIEVCDEMLARQKAIDAQQVS